MMKTDKQKEVSRMVGFGVRFEQDKLNEAKSKAGKNLGSVIRTLVNAWLKGEIDVVWEDGEFKVKK